MCRSLGILTDDTFYCMMLTFWKGVARRQGVKDSSCDGTLAGGSNRCVEGFCGLVVGSFVCGPSVNPLKPELNPICYLLALLAHHFLHVSRIRVKLLTFRRLMSYIYGAPILDVSRLHTTTQHSR